MTYTEICERLEVKGGMAKCPAHDDKNPSLSVTKGGDGRTLLKCHAGCTADAICKAKGFTVKDLFPQSRNGDAKEIIATYPYTDANGKPLYQCVRYWPKDFRQRRPDGNGWIWNLEGVDLVPYRLPALIRDVKRNLPIFLCEGEKDVETIVQLGFSGTCNPMGAGKWRDCYSEFLRGADVIIIVDKDEPGRKHASHVAESLLGVAKRVRTLELPDFNGKKVKDASDFFAAGAEASDLISEVDKIKTLAERLESRLFNIHVKPAESPLRYSLNGIPISTAGNITTESGPPKHGKSALAEAKIASVITDKPTEADCLGFASRNPDGHALIHLDSEQSEFDAYTLASRAVRRAGIAEPPPWLRSYYITGFSVPDARESIRIALAKGKRDFGGVHSLLLDGVADFVHDVNDPVESNAFVAELHALAIEYKCSDHGVIHFNPNTEKTRGHLGSQLERKAETNLKLERDGDAIIVWADKNRRAPIPKNKGPRFIWSEERQMFVTTECAAFLRDQVDRGELLDLAEAVFNGRPSIRHTDLIAGIMQKIGKGEDTGKRRCKRMIELGVIKKDFQNLYVLTQ